MRIAYHMPFKPLGHPNPSGDLVIGSALFAFLRQRGHHVVLVSRMRLRWFYWKPWLWLRFLFETARVMHQLQRNPPDLWLTYHSYYKAPDVLGAICTLIRPRPYFIFQGIYSTKRKRHWKTRPGFMLNRWVLGRADAVFTNKHRDEHNLRRLLPDDRVRYIASGINTALFRHDPAARKALRDEWGCGDAPVILTAAMFRPGVKTEGLLRTIQDCHGLHQQRRTFRLVICGAGATGRQLRAQARQQLGDRVIFAGKVARENMSRYYSAADIFAFPGIQEGLGMVYLEAQACGLPVVAYNRWGAAEVVRDGHTGLLCPPDNPRSFQGALDRLIQDENLRQRLGANARNHVCRHHDQEQNHRQFEKQLVAMASSLD